MLFDGYDLVVYGACVSTFLRDPTQLGNVTPAIAGQLGSYALFGVMTVDRVPSGSLKHQQLAVEACQRTIASQRLRPLRLPWGQTAMRPFRERWRPAAFDLAAPPRARLPDEPRGIVSRWGIESRSTTQRTAGMRK